MIKLKELKGRIISYIMVNGEIRYYRVTGERSEGNDNWLYLKQLFVPKNNFVTCISRDVIVRSYELVNNEYSINEFRSNFSQDELSKMRIDLVEQGHDVCSVDKMLMNFFTDQ